MHVLSNDQQLSVLNLLVEGNSLRSITRLTGIHRTSAMRLMVRAGNQVREFLDERLKGLHLNRIQCDEIWTFCLKKQGRIESGEHDEEIGDQYLFIALDEETKLIPTFVIGKRTLENTQLLMDDLAKRIVVPPLFDPSPKPLISTDGFRPYINAIELAFGGTVSHGVLVKDYAESPQVGRYGPPIMTATHRRIVSGNAHKREICTSHVERHNLSIRTFMRRFTRLALGFSKKLPNLAAATSLYIGHYNFCRWHNSLKMTPAMAAGLTGHPWTMEELVSQVV